jgi:hypothetical protein
MRFFLSAFAIVLGPEFILAQVSTFPYLEHFDTVAVPVLPAGWTTTTNRTPSGDFVTSTSTPRSGSAPNCVFSQNATISQTLTSPAFNFTNRTPSKLEFYTARSSTHTAGLLLEVSTDNGATFPIQLADTIRNTGTTSYVLTSISLPGSLFNQPTVKFRWRLVLSPSGGTTGTFRLEDVTVSVFTTYDLGVSKLLVAPGTPNAKDSLTLTATVKNFGAQTALGYSVRFFRDINNNQILEPSEQFGSLSGSPIGVSDSATIAATHPALSAGDHRFYTSISFGLDENATNDTLSAFISVGYAKGALLVNEFMYAPTGDEQEWVELFNPTTDTVNLKNWRISDNNVSTKTLISSSDVFVPPGGYVIVAQNASFMAIHPTVTAPVLLANFSALNNTTPDAVVLYDARSLSIDSVLYAQSWGGQNGRSLERVDTDQPSVNQSNWLTSQDSSGSTPGQFNSIGRLPFDLAFGSRFVTLATANNQVVPVLNAFVKNLGKQAASSFSVSFYADINRNSAAEPNELLATVNAPSTLSPNDSSMFSYTWPSAPAGVSTVFMAVSFGPDLRTSNNSTSLAVQVAYESRTLVVNEIMYDPLSNQNEWIELFNRGSSPIDMAGWKFSDRPTTSGANTFTITSQTRIVQPGEFVVVAAESSILQLYPNLQSSVSNLQLFILNRPGGFSFGNDGDDIVLKDLTGKAVDSISYSPTWHHPDVADTKGRSLERINPNLDANDPRNWSTATGFLGGSPGGSNTIFTRTLPASASLSISPNPFSPDGDRFEDFCSISYDLPSSTSIIHLRIYDIRGRLIRTLANAEFSGAKGSVIWDGLDNGKQRARIGPYVVLIEALDSQGGTVYSAKTVVVVATRL